MKYGIIFDVDGVLVDSYHAHHESWLALARETRRSFTEAEFASVFGRTSADIIRVFWPPDEIDDEKIRALDDRKEALYRDIVEAEFPAMDGAVELIDSLTKAGFLLAVGSSGPPENVNLVLDRLDRRAAFGAAITGFDVNRGKPDPQVFQLAAKRLNIPPERCAVVEDAPAGIAAAHAASMIAIGLTSTGRTPEELNAADLIVPSLRNLTPQTTTNLINR